jgi:flagellar FliJ protein
MEPEARRMTRSDRVKPVIKVAKNRERDAARVLSDAQRTVQAQQDRLRELMKYREEYRAGFAQRGGSGVSAAQLRTMRGFMEKLDLAVEQQERIVRDAQAELENRRRQWLEKHLRTQALDHVREKYVSEEQRHANRVEQKDADERSQRRVRATDTDHDD